MTQADEWATRWAREIDERHSRRIAELERQVEEARQIARRYGDHLRRWCGDRVYNSYFADDTDRYPWLCAGEGGE